MMNPIEKDILKAIELLGGVTATVAEQNGWTVRGMPTKELRDLINRKVVAPKVLTSYPLRIVWQAPRTHRTQESNIKLSKECNRLNYKDFSYQFRKR